MTTSTLRPETPPLAAPSQTFTPVEEKIQLLLDKAASTSAHEAEALTVAAEKLMIKHGIDEAMLSARADGKKAEEVIRIELAFSGIYKRVFESRLAEIPRALGTCKTYLGRYQESYNAWRKPAVFKLFIVGHKSSAEAAERLVRSLELQALVAMKEFWKNSPQRGLLSAAEGFNERREFIVNFIAGAAARIAENVNHEVIATTGAEMVLASRLIEVDAAMPDGLRRVRRRYHAGSDSAEQAGRIAGAQAATGERGIGYGQRGIAQ